MHQTALPTEVVGVLVSGGLDSCILAHHLLAGGAIVQPLYVRFGLAWESAEEHALRQFLAALEPADRLRPLVAFDLPTADIYGPHWSTTGADVPGADSPDEAVYLPGRNPLLLIKAVLWCQLNGIDTVALAPLASNPFPDATAAFFDSFAQMCRLATGEPICIERPFGQMSKQQVMQLGRGLPLERTFSCIDPQGLLHCGQCNKCAERQAAFRSIALPDPTTYAQPPLACTPM